MNREGQVLSAGAHAVPSMQSIASNESYRRYQGAALWNPIAVCLIYFGSTALQLLSNTIGAFGAYNDYAFVKLNFSTAILTVDLIPKPLGTNPRHSATRYFDRTAAARLRCSPHDSIVVHRNRAGQADCSGQRAAVQDRAAHQRDRGISQYVSGKMATRADGC
jgi:hypothetical protein